MEYLSSFAIYQEVIDGMDAMGITKEEFAENLHMSVDELDEFLTPIRDYTISEIQNLMGALYLDIKIEVVPEQDGFSKIAHTRNYEKVIKL